MKTMLSRRRLLRGMVAGAPVAVGLPLLECMLDRNGTALADGTALPLRFGVFFWGSGLPPSKRNDPKLTLPDLYTPATTGTDWGMTELLRPLEAHRSAINVITGYTPKQKIPSSMNDGHMQGQTVVLTGDRVSTKGWDHSGLYYTYNRPSIDQVIAAHPGFYGGVKPRFPTLELRVSRASIKYHSGWVAISMRGPLAPNVPLGEPIDLYKYLLTAMKGPLTDRQRQIQLGVLDAVAADARPLLATMGAGDRVRVQDHLDGLASIQARIRTLEMETARCQPPTKVPPVFPHNEGRNDANNEKTLLARADLMADMLVLALQCDLTRVFTFQFTCGASGVRISAAGVLDVSGPDMHICEHEVEKEDYAARCQAFTKLNLTAYARLLDKLAAARDPAGRSLLDTSVVLGTSEYGSGRHHSLLEQPLILAGKAGGALRTGHHVRVEGGNVCDAHVTIFRALGLEQKEWGWNGGETTTPVPGLLTT